VHVSNVQNVVGIGYVAMQVSVLYKFCFRVPIYAPCGRFFEGWGICGETPETESFCNVITLGMRYPVSETA